MQRAVTGYRSEQELLAAFHDATLLLFTQEGQTGLYTIVEDDGSRYIPAFTHPPTPPTPGTSGNRPPAITSPPPASRSASTPATASA
ncbi:hypothetical protein AB0C95_12730 [Streptomyces caniferus]|uniref:hypothetical protein n=1 Tax=Streptomyces caniferus TaxID=285557 RepID=UPI0033F63651